jgi:alpha-L-fucosidase
LLNNTPDTSGLIPAPHATRTAEFGQEIRTRFAKPVATAHGSDETIEIKLPRPARIDHAVLMEDLSKGQHVDSYAIFGLAGDTWHELSRGATIGHKKIDAFPAVEVSRVNLRLLGNAANANIKSCSLFNTGAATADLAYRVVYDWKPESFDSGHTTWDIDLRPFALRKGEYELTFVATGGDVIVKSVSLLPDGSESADAVTPLRNRVYRLTVPEGTSTLDLRVVISPAPDDQAYGQIALTALPH